MDASVAVKWLIAENGHEAAMELLIGQDELHAPRLLASEFANAIRGKAARGEITSRDSRSAVAAIQELPLRWGFDETDADTAHKIASGLGHPVYDCVYLAMAIRIGGLMVTADEGFGSKVKSGPNAEFLATLDEYTRRLD